MVPYIRDDCFLRIRIMFQIPPRELQACRTLYLSPCLTHPILAPGYQVYHSPQGILLELHHPLRLDRHSYNVNKPRGLSYWFQFGRSPPWAQTSKDTVTLWSPVLWRGHFCIKRASRVQIIRMLWQPGLLFFSLLLLFLLLLLLLLCVSFLFVFLIKKNLSF